MTNLNFFYRLYKVDGCKWDSSLDEDITHNEVLTPLVVVEKEIDDWSTRQNYQF